MGSPDVCVSRGRVLIIDDDRLCAMAIERTLNVRHDVVSVTSAGAALQLLAAGARFDVILCDLMMPDVTGMDFHAAVQRLHPEIVREIIFLTGGASTDRARQFLAEVPNLIVEKPVTGPHLLALVDDRLA